MLRHCASAQCFTRLVLASHIRHAESHMCEGTVKRDWQQHQTTGWRQPQGEWVSWAARCLLPFPVAARTPVSSTAGPRSLLFFCLHLACFHPDQITDVCPCALRFPHCSFQQPCRAHRQDLMQQQRVCRHKLKKNIVKNVNKDHQLMRSRCHQQLRQHRQLEMRQRRNSPGPHRQVILVPEPWNQPRDLEKPLSS